MDSKSIRYQNTRLLVDSVGGVSNFAEKIGKGQSQTSQFAGTNPIKGIGNKVAREIEEAFEKPHGWLDVPHETYSSLASSYIKESNTINNKNSHLDHEFQNFIKTLNILKTNEQLSIELLQAFNSMLIATNNPINKRKDSK